jgi:hypothetical protein
MEVRVSRHPPRSDAGCARAPRARHRAPGTPRGRAARRRGGATRPKPPAPPWSSPSGPRQGLGGGRRRLRRDPPRRPAPSGGGARRSGWTDPPGAQRRPASEEPGGSRPPSSSATTRRATSSDGDPARRKRPSRETAPRASAISGCCSVRTAARDAVCPGRVPHAVPAVRRMTSSATLSVSRRPSNSAVTDRGARGPTPGATVPASAR